MNESIWNTETDKERGGSVCVCVTFLEAFDLLVGERGAIPLKFPLETQTHLRILVARWIVVRIAVRDVAVLAICFEDQIKIQFIQSIPTTISRDIYCDVDCDTDQSIIPILVIISII